MDTPQNCLQRELAAHCAAVLLRAKPAALFSLKAEDCAAGGAHALLTAGGLQVEILRHGRQRTLLLAWLPDLMETALKSPTAQKALAGLGYPVDAGAEAMLQHLKARMAGSEDFPHEIGFFLGYPPSDVMGFIIHGGRRFKHCCMWKVYSNVERAKQMCSKYEACRRFCLGHLARGGNLHSLTAMLNKAE